MPELPEVETIRAQLAPRLEGRTLTRVEILDPRLTRPYDLFEVTEELEGDRIAAVERRGKYLVLRLESGLVLLVHLRMTGSFGFEPVSHERAVLELDDGTRLVYRDVRRFGTWLVLEGAELDPYLAGRTGPEPLGSRFTAEWLARRLSVRRAPVKAVLLDQRVVAGLGNIYADEALWRARLNPLRPASSVEPEEVRPLHRAIRAALRAGVERQGATLRDYAAPDGSSGGMQEEFRVYGREGEPCPRCGTPIAKTRVGGRGTWFCPRCQPLPLLVRFVTMVATETQLLCSRCGRPAPGDPAELRTWRHGELALESEVGEGLLLCPDCDAEDRERQFEEGEGG